MFVAKDMSARYHSYARCGKYNRYYEPMQRTRINGSHPKSLMALEAPWMLGLAAQRGLRDCSRYHASAPGIPGSVEGAGLFYSLGRNAGLSARSEVPPETESVSVPPESREIRHARGLVGPPKYASRHHGRPSVLWKAHKPVMQHYLSTMTRVGQTGTRLLLPNGIMELRV